MEDNLTNRLLDLWNSKFPEEKIEIISIVPVEESDTKIFTEKTNNYWTCGCKKSDDEIKRLSEENGILHINCKNKNEE